MTDREKVIKESEEAVDILAKAEEPTFWLDFVRCAFENALALLKEQPEIVRCEDCKHRPTYPEAYGAEINGRWCYWCELLMAWKPDDWFCANGKRR